MNFDVYYIKPIGILQVMAFPAEEAAFAFIPPAGRGTSPDLRDKWNRCRGRRNRNYKIIFKKD
jgi:hypothetical protein